VAGTESKIFKTYGPKVQMQKTARLVGGKSRGRQKAPGACPHKNRQNNEKRPKKMGKVAWQGGRGRGLGEGARKTISGVQFPEAKAGAPRNRRAKREWE